MLPQSTIDLINGQIEEELSHLNSIFCDTQQDKMETLERINKLRSMLTTDSPAPSPEPEIQEVEINLDNALKNLAGFFKRNTK